jgi:hypothetical protein
MKFSAAATAALILFIALVEGGGQLAPPVPDRRAANIPHLAQGTGRKAIVEAPINYAVYPGETVTFRCSVAQAPPSSRVMWAELISSQGGSTISDNENLLAHPNRDRYYIVHNTPTEFHLQITDVRLEDGGQYVCQDSLAGPPDVFRGFASLIVIASPPNCTNTSPPNGNVIEGQEFTIECSTWYQGTYPPTKRWSGPDPFEVYYAPPSPTTVWAGIRYTVNRGMDIQFYECLTNFTDLGELPADTARNPPSWEYLYRAPQMFVSWGPMNMSATPIKPAYDVGDLITCTADAKPGASYQWQNLRSLATYNSNTYTITEDMRGYNDSLRCSAQNIIQGNVYQANLFIFAYLPPITTPTTTQPTEPTTTPPAVSSCEMLTGRWRSDDPYAEAILHVIQGDNMGRVEGLMMNRSDTFWVEVIGTTRVQDYAYLGLSAIWPYDSGVTSISAECHRCLGIEVMHVDGMWKSIHASPACGEVAPQTTYPSHAMRRVGTTREALEEPLRVWQPSAVSKRLGVTLKK